MMRRATIVGMSMIYALSAPVNAQNFPSPTQITPTQALFGTPYDDPNVPLTPFFLSLNTIGDINNGGASDYGFSLGIANETGAVTWRSFIKLGESNQSNSLYDYIIENTTLRFGIGDFNGDGYPDFYGDGALFLGAAAPPFTRVNLNLTLFSEPYFIDYNNDGYNDILMGGNSLGSSNTILFAYLNGREQVGSSLDMTNVVVSELPDLVINDQTYSRTVSQSNRLHFQRIDGKTYLFHFSANALGETNLKLILEIFELGENRELNRVYIKSYGEGFPIINNLSGMAVRVSDFDLNGTFDIALLRYPTAPNGVFIIHGADRSPDATTTQVSGWMPDFHDNYVHLFTNSVLGFAGDMNDDGIEDFFDRQTSTPTIVLSNHAEFGRPISPVKQATLNTEEHRIELHRLFTGHFSYTVIDQGYGTVESGKVNGKSSILLRSNVRMRDASSNDFFIHRIQASTIAVKHTSTTTSSVESTLLYTVNEGQYVDFSPTGTFNLGDFDGDGIDDFAVIFQRYNDSRIFGYKGGSTIDYEDPLFTVYLQNWLAHDLVAIDLNGDGKKDLVYTAGINSSRALGIHFQREGSFPIQGNADVFRNVADIYPEGTNIGFFQTIQLANVGDINGDGVEDLAFVRPDDTTFGSKNQVAFIWGIQDGTAEDFHRASYVLEYQNAFAVTPGTAAFRVTALGDVNGDGAPDFAVSSTRALYPYNTDPEKFIGAVYVHFGIPAGSLDSKVNYDSIFRTPSAVLYPDSTYVAKGKEMMEFGYFVTAGDYNGDGINDIVVSAYASGNDVFDTDNHIAFVFYGGETISTQSTHQVTIEGTPFFTQPAETAIRQFAPINIPTKPLRNHDNLLLVSNSAAAFGTPTTHSAVVTGGQRLSSHPQSVLMGTNAGKMSPINAVSGSYLPAVAVGDFTGTGKISVLAVGRTNPPGTELKNNEVVMYELNETAVSINREPTSEKASEFALLQNYPNPFNPSTRIQFHIPQSSTVKLEVFTLLGQKVATLTNEFFQAGNHTVNFEASGLASGMYLYRIQVGTFVQTKKMMLVK